MCVRRTVWLTYASTWSLQDIDNHILLHLVEQFKKEQGIDLTKDKLAVQRLREAAEKCKIELSSTNSVRPVWRPNHTQ